MAIVAKRAEAGGWTGIPGFTFRLLGAASSSMACTTWMYRRAEYRPDGRMREGPGRRWLALDQRHGLRARPPGRLQALRPATGSLRYAKVLPHFRRSETWEGGAHKCCGGDGPFTPQTVATPTRS
jgi:hypothetical protein